MTKRFALKFSRHDGSLFMFILLFVAYQHKAFVSQIIDLFVNVPPYNFFLYIKKTGDKI